MNFEFSKILYLTPNRRLSFYLQNFYIKNKSGQNDRIQNISQTPIFFLKVWYQHIWKFLQNFDNAQPRVLTESEENLIWENITGRRTFGMLAREAYHLCLEWQLEINNFEEASEECLNFKVWVQRFRSECKILNACSESEVLPRILARLHSDSEFSKNFKHQFSNPVIWIGFEHFTPLQESFFKYLQDVGIKTTKQSLLYEENTVFRCELADFSEEVKTALTWAQEKILQEPDEKQFNVSKKIGIIIPELGKRAQEVSRVVASHPSCAAVAISVPRTLLSFPWVQGHFLGLRLLSASLSFETVSIFLRGLMAVRPGNDHSDIEKIIEWNLGASFEVFLRDRKNLNSDSILWVDILGWLSEFELRFKKNQKSGDRLEACNSVFQKLKLNIIEFSEISKLCHEKKTVSEWKLIFERGWKILGEGGDAQEDSFVNKLERNAVVNAWTDILQEWERLGSLLGVLEFEQAVQSLKNLAQDKLIAIDLQQHNKPIQIMGLFEGLGLPFEGLWVIGLNRDNWPSYPQPNPFIPYSVQKQQGLPHSSAARELEMAKGFTQQLCRGAEEVIFSMGLSEDDQEKHPSSLLNFIPIIKIEELIDLNRSKNKAMNLEENASDSSIVKNKTFKIDFNEQARNISLESDDSKFGSDVFKLQSLCPFRAFSELRLKAKPLQDPELINFSAARRGEMIHAILNLIWQEIRSHQALVNLSEEGLGQIVEEAIEKVISEYQFMPRFLMQEKQRLRGLLFDCLRLEKQRAAFEVIKLEEKQNVQIGALNLNIRVDRRDRVGNEDEVIVDYKTGQTSLSAWFGERPLDPQLPLYGLAQEKKPVALVLNSIRSGGIGYQGISEDSASDILPGLKTIADVQRYGAKASLEEQWEAWKTVLEKLAHDFVTGQAAVDPVQGETTCRVCSLKPLCRVAEKDNV